MKLFDKFKKKKAPETKSNLLLSMPLFNSAEDYSWEKVADDLKTYWNLNVTVEPSDKVNDNSIAILKVENETVPLAFMPGPVP